MTGFFGKLPAAGDFVARGLPQGVRPVLDRWLTRHLVFASEYPEDWPEAGIYALITGPAGPLSVALIASHDASGRRFPLAACAPAASDRTGHEAWGAEVVALLQAAHDKLQNADALQAALSLQSDPAPAADTPLAPPCLWSGARADMAPDDPARALPAIFPGLSTQVTL